MAHMNIRRPRALLSSRSYLEPVKRTVSGSGRSHRPDPAAPVRSPRVARLSRQSLRLIARRPARSAAPLKSAVRRRSRFHAAICDLGRLGGRRRPSGHAEGGRVAGTISDRYGVPVKAIVNVNGFADANSVRAGQRVIVPVYVYARDKSGKAEACREAAPVEKTPAPNQKPTENVAVLPKQPRLKEKEPQAKLRATTQKGEAPIAASTRFIGRLALLDRQEERHDHRCDAQGQRSRQVVNR
jgi:LysM repeat protein